LDKINDNLSKLCESLCGDIETEDEGEAKDKGGKNAQSYLVQLAEEKKK